MTLAALLLLGQLLYPENTTASVGGKITLQTQLPYGSNLIPLVSASGQHPGFRLPSGLHVPLNLDQVSESVCARPDLFIGLDWCSGYVYDTYGGVALTVFVPLHQQLVGTTLTVVVVWSNGEWAVTNPATISIR